VHGVVPDPGVEDVDEADGSTVDHQGQRHQTPVAPTAVGLPFGLAEVGGLEVADHHRLVGGQRRHRPLVRRQLTLRAHLVLVPAVTVHAGETAQQVAVDLPDVTVLCLQHRAQPFCDRSSEIHQRAGPAEAVAELDQLTQCGVAAAQPQEQLGVAQRVGDRAARLRQEPPDLVEVTLTHVEEVDQADDLVVAHQRRGDAAAEAELRVILDLVLREAFVLERADDQDLAVFKRLPRRRVVVETQDLAAQALVGAVVVDARETAQIPLFGPPDVAVGAVHRLAQPGRGAFRDEYGVVGGGQVGAQCHQFFAQAVDLVRLVEQCGAVEHPGHELAGAGDELKVGAPAARGVVVELEQAHELATGDERHRQRAGEAPRRHGGAFDGGQPWVVQVLDAERCEVEQRAFERRVAAGVEHLAGQVRVRALTVAAHCETDHASGHAPYVHAIRVGDGEQPLREAHDEPLEVPRLRDLTREGDQLTQRPVALREVLERPPDADGLGADPREAEDRILVGREIPVPGVGEFQRSDDPVLERERDPCERPAAATQQREPGFA